MSDIICGRHQYNGMVIGEPCPICVMEEETKTTPQDKIERLRDTLKYEQRESAAIMPMAAEILCLKERIEGLEEDRDAERVTWINVVNGRDDCIEELEQSLAALDEHQADKHFTTDAQIDAAVAEAQDEFAHHGTKRAWLALKKLGIERCSVCDRCPGKQYEWGKGDELQPCANCNGKGWVHSVL